MIPMETMTAFFAACFLLALAPGPDNIFALPQFASPERSPLARQLLLLGVVFIGATLLVFGSIALLAGMIGRRLGSSHKAQQVMNWVAGSIFAGLALRLATAERY